MYYQSTFNIFDIIKLDTGENPRDYSEFLVPISQQEYETIDALKNNPRFRPTMEKMIRETASSGK